MALLFYDKICFFLFLFVFTFFFFFKCMSTIGRGAKNFNRKWERGLDRALALGKEREEEWTLMERKGGMLRSLRPVIVSMFSLKRERVAEICFFFGT